MKIIKCILLTLCFSTLSVSAQNAKSKDSGVMKKMIQDNFVFAEKQYQYLEKATPLDSMPKTFENNRNVSSNAYDWCSGFYPGTLLYIYEYTNKPLLLVHKEMTFIILKDLD
jgi:hypothetical protein